MILWKSTPRLAGSKLWRPTNRRPQQALSVRHYFSPVLRKPKAASDCLMNFFSTSEMKPRSNHIWTCSHFIGWSSEAFFAVRWSCGEDDTIMDASGVILLAFHFLKSIIEWWCDRGLAILIHRPDIYSSSLATCLRLWCRCCRGIGFSAFKERGTI